MLFSAGAFAAEVKLNEMEQQFQKSLSGSTLVGHFTMSNKPSNDLSEERYTISKLTKVTGKKDTWRFVVRINYGKYDVNVPLDLQVNWAGDTPMITLTDFAIPALGTFSARVLFHGDRYSGTWQHGKVGGHLFGRIESEVTDKKVESKSAS
jgi:hypothetical protein